MNPASPQQPSIDIVELLAHALPGARPESHRWLAGNARVPRVAPGELIFRQGDPIPVTLVVDGHGAFRRATRDGRELRAREFRSVGSARSICLSDFSPRTYHKGET